MDFSEAVRQFAAHLLTARGRARATAESYRGDLLQFSEVTGVRILGDLTRAAVLRWLDELAARELSPRSRARKLSALRTFCSWAVEYGLLERDPIPAETSAPPALRLPRALSEAEVAAIIAAADRNAGAEGLRDRAMLEALYATGMRVSELCSLRLIDLRLAEGFAIVTGKGGKQRLTPLGQYAIDAVREYLAQGRGVLCPGAVSRDEVFLTRRGPISRSQVFRIVKRYAALAGITAQVSPHTFRHSCASHLLARGADLRLVQELLGHASLATTEIYTHIDKARLRKVYDECHPMA
jgi:integrase/recombinase XerD